MNWRALGTASRLWSRHTKIDDSFGNDHDQAPDRGFAEDLRCFAATKSSPAGSAHHD
jgi:hypothetical protein